MRFVNFFSILLIVVFALACSHTNKLSKYELNNKNVHFTQKEEPNAKDVKIQFNEAPITGGATEAQIDAVADAGSTVISSSIEPRFKNGVDTDKLLDKIVYDLQKSLGDIYNIKIEETSNELTDFTFETKLTKCQLEATSLGINVTVEADAVIYDKKNSQIIWEYSGSGVAPIQKIKSIMLDQEHNSATSVVNVAELERITDEQIQKSVQQATEMVRLDIVEALQEDLAGEN